MAAKESTKARTIEDSEVVYFLKLRRDDYGDLRELAKISPGLIAIAQVDAAINRAAVIRLEFAESILLFASSLDESGSDIVARS